METVSRCARPNPARLTSGELGDCEEGEVGGYDTCARLSLQWRAPKSDPVAV